MPTADLPKGRQNHSSKPKTNLTVFIDESGTLPDPNDDFIVICGAVVEEVKKAENIISRVQKSLRQIKEILPEAKFYYAGTNTKRQFLSGIVATGVEIFALVIDKKGRKIGDTAENFALLIKELISELFLWYQNAELSLVIDRHFHKETDRNKFDRILKNIYDNRIRIEHVDSQSNSLVNIADMSAGSIRWKYAGKSSRFYELIKDNIIVEKVVNWPEIKRKNIAQNKRLTRTGASAHPGEI